MLTLTIVLRICFSHNCFFFSIPVHPRVTIVFGGNFRKIVIFDQNALLFFCCFFFHLNIRKIVFRLKTFLFVQLKTNLKSELSLMRYMFSTFLLYMGFIWKRPLENFE